MANLKALAKDTAIYGLSSIVGRFLNYLLVPLYTHVISAASGGYGVVTNLYAYTALLLVVLTFGMETTFFRFMNDEKEEHDTVFSVAFGVIALLTSVFLGLVFGFSSSVSSALGYADNPEYVQLMASVVALDALQALPFCHLRYRHKAMRFASLKLLFIAMNIGLNLLFFLVLGYRDVLWVFALNLVCTGVITFFFIPDVLRIRWKFDWGLLRRMLSYSWPILVLGIMGILNQAADKMIFTLVYPDTSVAKVELGIYGSCVKVAMIMAMITQAFRYAYEPIVFAKSKDSDKAEYYALGMKYFVIFTLLAFLAVMGYLPLLRYMVGSDYWAGLRVIPIVMAAEIMMGIYFNLSFWYKLIDKTYYGALFSMAGCIVLLAVNLWGIPRYSYMACAWGGFAGYGTAMLLSYIVGQRLYPIPYPLRSLAGYTAIAGAFYGAMTLVPSEWPMWQYLAISTLLILAFAAIIYCKELRRKISA
ncbi:MAG: lipopolysaccharide biosynthesis protein [Bacteroidaceae bacterium]|nr:lipopolysaccharide biosynthesis protein [Bacteroidaceae bacterium]MBO7167154.1 lipopolysaccharide biosynthesis protein [Bacteroidaceae bacterium]